MSTVNSSPKKLNYARLPDRKFKIYFAAMVDTKTNKTARKMRSEIRVGRSVEYRVVPTSEESATIWFQLLGADGFPVFEWDADDIAGYEVLPEEQPTPPTPLKAVKE